MSYFAAVSGDVCFAEYAGCSGAAIGTKAVARWPLIADASMFDLTLFMWERNQGLSGSVEYNTDLFDAERIERMVGHFQTLLEGIVADPGASAFVICRF